MKQLVVRGGSPLYGEVEIEGAKNAALPILFATLLADGTSTIHRLPKIGDVQIAIDILRSMGAICSFPSSHTLNICTDRCFCQTKGILGCEKLRGSIYLLGAAIGRFGEAFCPFPGGCKLGVRPIDQHLKVLSALGADIAFEEGGIHAKAHTLSATTFTFDIASVGATINGMLTATQAKGTTVLKNVAKEPHVKDVANLLNAFGAKIEGAGSDTIYIEGKTLLHGGEYTLIGDGMEAGTYMILGAATGGGITVKGICPKDLESLVTVLREMGVEVSHTNHSIIVKGNDTLLPIRVKTGPHPQFPTDLHPPLVALLSACKGESIVEETIWHDRFQYLEALTKMGLKTKRKDATLMIEGGGRLRGAKVCATDLRGGAVALILALMAKGESIIRQADYIFRGYEGIAEKCRSLGGDVWVEDYLA